MLIPYEQPFMFQNSASQCLQILIQAANLAQEVCMCNLLHCLQWKAGSVLDQLHIF